MFSLDIFLPPFSCQTQSPSTRDELHDRIGRTDVHGNAGCASQSLPHSAYPKTKSRRSARVAVRLIPPRKCCVPKSLPPQVTSLAIAEHGRVGRKMEARKYSAWTSSCLHFSAKLKIPSLRIGCTTEAVAGTFNRRISRPAFLCERPP